MNEKIKDAFYNLAFYLLMVALFAGIVAIFYIPMHNDRVSNGTIQEMDTAVGEEDGATVVPRIPESIIYHNLDVEIGLPY